MKTIPIEKATYEELSAFLDGLSIEDATEVECYLGLNFCWEEDFPDLSHEALEKDREGQDYFSVPKYHLNGRHICCTRYSRGRHGTINKDFSCWIPE